MSWELLAVLVLIVKGNKIWKWGFEENMAVCGSLLNVVEGAVLINILKVSTISPVANSSKGLKPVGAH